MMDNKTYLGANFHAFKQGIFIGYVSQHEVGTKLLEFVNLAGFPNQSFD